MIQQESAEQGEAARSHSPLSRVFPGQRAKAAAAALLLTGLAVGYIAGQQRPTTHQADVRCLSASGAISCTDDRDLGHGEFWVPRDIAWTDSEGSLHVGGRPECLPPSGRGVEGPVGITWIPVEFSGTSWKQAVGVVC